MLFHQQMAGNIYEWRRESLLIKFTRGGVRESIFAPFFIMKNFLPHHSLIHSQPQVHKLSIINSFHFSLLTLPHSFHSLKCEKEKTSKLTAVRWNKFSHENIIDHILLYMCNDDEQQRQRTTFMMTMMMFEKEGNKISNATYWSEQDDWKCIHSLHISQFFIYFLLFIYLISIRNENIFLVLQLEVCNRSAHSRLRDIFHTSSKLRYILIFTWNFRYEMTHFMDDGMFTNLIFHHSLSL